MAEMRDPLVHLDEMRFIGLGLDHEVQTTEPRNPEAANQAFRRLADLRIVDYPDDRRRPQRTCGNQYFGLDNGENFALPATDDTGGRAARDEALRIKARAHAVQ